MSMVSLAIDNVASLPISNLQDIAAMARKFADDLDAGRHGDVFRAVLVVQDQDAALSMYGWGENTSAFELMGLFEAAKLRVFADDLNDC